MTTIFGPDVSSFQRGLDVSTLTDPFVILKCTEGTYYSDAAYGHWLDQARASGKLVIAYHFVKTESSAQAQAVMLATHIEDVSLPVMLDVETEGSSTPRLPLVLDVIDAMKAKGLNVRLVYLPRWYWQQIGSPDLTPLTARDVGVVSSAYPLRGSERPVQGYVDSGGDTGPGWAAYGGVTPVLWQYTDAGLEQQPIDFNAFRGTIDHLASLLRGGSISTGDDVNLSDTVKVSPGFAQRYPRAVSDGFAANTDVSVSVLLEGSAIRAANNEHLLTDVSAKLDQLLAVKPPTVDAAAIATQVVAAITQHLAGGVDVKAVAVAVQAQLALALGHAAA